MECPTELREDFCKFRTLEAAPTGNSHLGIPDAQSRGKLAGADIQEANYYRITVS